MSAVCQGALAILISDFGSLEMSLNIHGLQMDENHPRLIILTTSACSSDMSELQTSKSGAVGPYEVGAYKKRWSSLSPVCPQK